jgi:Spy/CpxP family protein refolding chaperone
MKNILLASVLALVAASAGVAPSQAETIVVKHGRHHCVTKLVTHWRHHHKVVEKVKVCR